MLTRNLLIVLSALSVLWFVLIHQCCNSELQNHFILIFIDLQQNNYIKIKHIETIFYSLSQKLILNDLKKVLRNSILNFNKPITISYAIQKYFSNFKFILKIYASLKAMIISARLFSELLVFQYMFNVVNAHFCLWYHLTAFNFQAFLPIKLLLILLCLCRHFRFL